MILAWLAIASGVCAAGVFIHMHVNTVRRYSAAIDAEYECLTSAVVPLPLEQSHWFVPDPEDPGRCLCGDSAGGMWHLDAGEEAAA